MGFACNPDDTFPFATTCKHMATTGPCNKDSDCSAEVICYPGRPGSSESECLLAFSQEDYKQFGVRYDYSLSYYENILIAGLYCKSGIAFINSFRNVSTCVSIEKITSNRQENYIRSSTEALASPYYCSLADEILTACRYWYKNRAGSLELLASTHCDCSLDADLNAQDIGVCPYPGQEQMTTYANALRYVLDNTNCQTVDWNNMAA